MQNTQQPRTDLQGKVAIVTGASSGIGEAIAEELVKRNAYVALTARREDRLQELEQRLRGIGNAEILTVPGDVSKPEDVQQLVNQTVQRWGKLDIVVANAGFGYRAHIVDGDIQRWKNLLNTNVYGLLLTLKYGVQKLLENGSGHVIVTSSIAGRQVTAGGAVYSGSKFAVNAIAEALRQEVGQQGVRVTTVEPGAVVTEFAEVAGYSSEVIEAIKQMEPLQASDIARVIIQALEQPAHVDIAELTVYPTKQTGQGVFANTDKRQQ
ncbi:SDR family oxidoreductase [Dictyobacter kobayashii]|uniref:Oxidoreductase n=1 Tax=Dictyobacter kobayashii TaxID=2014872 RepID=A0A402ASB1_9CHLR|nr:SDR family oxidoreductase [Dictyobacter kobayashii]GCE21990.1 oxidoreductase [Dictyobacter kobayashii]